MNRTEIRTMIRTLLAEELGRIKHTVPEALSTKQEVVKIGNDQELAVFVKRLAGRCKDETTRREIEQGALTFTLSGSVSGSCQTQTGSRMNGQPARFEKGFINERQIDALSESTEVVVAAKAVRFTPLALDRLRQRGIRIERKAS